MLYQQNPFSKISNGFFLRSLWKKMSKYYSSEKQLLRITKGYLLMESGLGNFQPQKNEDALF